MNVQEQMKLLGQRIRFARQKAKLSQTELGKRIDYSLNGIAKIERGESDPKFSALLKIADALEIDIGDLVLGAEPLGSGRSKLLTDSLLTQALAAGLRQVIEEAPDSDTVLKELAAEIHLLERRS